MKTKQQLKKTAESKGNNTFNSQRSSKYTGYNVEYFVRYLNAHTETKSTYFHEYREVQGWVDEHFQATL